MAARLRQAPAGVRGDDLARRPPLGHRRHGRLWRIGPVLHALAEGPLWIGKVDGDSTDVVAATERIYLVGHYDHGVADKDDPCLKHAPVSCPFGTPHRKLIAYDARSGDTDASFTAQANTRQGPYVALVGAHHLYVGGDFTLVGPYDELRSQGGFAQFDQIETARPVSPAPRPPKTTTTTAR